MKPFRVIVAGGRDFNDYELMKRKLDHILSKVSLKRDIIIISGTARGADSLGERYAREKGYKVERFSADWNRFGKSAGYKRNTQMAEVAQACICFWDQNSRGTQHMINIARDKELKVRIIYY